MQSQKMKDRGEDIQKAWEDVEEKIIDEKWDEDDLEDADNWDEYEDLQDELEDLEKDCKITEDIFGGMFR